MAKESTVKKTEKTEEYVAQDESYDNAPQFVVGSESYPMRNVSISIYLMEFSKASKRAAREEPHKPHPDMGVCKCPRCVRVRSEREAAGFELLTTMYDCMKAMVFPEFHDELIEYVKTAGLPPGELENAIAESMGKLAEGSEDGEGKESVEAE